MQTRAKRKREERERELWASKIQYCSVCDERVFPGFVRISDRSVLPVNGVKCINDHATCAECARKIAQPVRWCGSNFCSSFGFKCPLCRSMSCLHKVEIFTLMRGHNTDLKEIFDGAQAFYEWAAASTEY